MKPEYFSTVLASGKEDIGRIAKTLVDRMDAYLVESYATPEEGAAECKLAALDFLNTLDPEATSYDFRVLTPDGGRGRGHNRSGALEKWFDWMCGMNRAGGGVFMTVHATDGRGVEKKNITRPRAIICDFDAGIPDTVPLQPNIIVSSSQGKAHYYWLIDPATAPSVIDWQPVEDAWVNGLCGDPGAKDAARILRLPGFFHVKDQENPQLVTAEYLREDPYKWGELVAAAPKAQQGTKPATGATTGAPGYKHHHQGIGPWIFEEKVQQLGRKLRRGDGGRDLLKRYIASQSGRAQTWEEIAALLDLIFDKYFDPSYPRHEYRIDELIFHFARKDDAKLQAHAGVDLSGLINQHIGGFGYTLAQVDAFKAADSTREFFWDVDTCSWHEVRKPEPCVAKEENPADTSPFDLSYPPGLAGQIAQHIFDSARMPVKSFAVAGALQTLSYLNSNKSWIACSDTALNLYQCLSGATGAGKDGPRQAIKSILNAAFPLHLSGVSESVASAPALLRALETGKEQLILTDEFGIFLQIAISEKGSMHLKELVKELLTLYGLGRSSYSGKIYSDAKFNIGRIDKPYCSVFGTTTPLELVDGISHKAVDNGFLNRILFVQASEANPINRFAKKDVPETLVECIRALLNSPPGAMQYEEGAHDFMVSCVDHMQEPGLFKNLWTRAEEQMIRVAGLLALGDGGVIKKEHVAWANKYVTWCIKSFSKFLGEDLAETSFQKTVAKASKLIRGARQYSTDKQFGEICKKGLMPRSKLLKLMKLPAREMDDLIKYLMESGTFAAGTAGGYSVLYDPA